jgi:hypothetical protein
MLRATECSCHFRNATLVGHCRAQRIKGELRILSLVRNDMELRLTTFNETDSPAWAMMPPQGTRHAGVTEIMPSIGVM